MIWFRRFGWAILFVGLLCVIPMYNASESRSRWAAEYLADQQSAAMDGGERFPDAVRRLPYTEAKWKEAEAVHERWILTVLGGVGIGVFALVTSFAASRLARRAVVARPDEVRESEPSGRG